MSNFVSCDACGVVLDADVLHFEVQYREDGSVNTRTAYWDGEEYVPFVKCPVCGHPVTLPYGEHSHE